MCLQTVCHRRARAIRADPQDTRFADTLKRARISIRPNVCSSPNRCLIVHKVHKMLSDGTAYICGNGFTIFIVYQFSSLAPVTRSHCELFTAAPRTIQHTRLSERSHSPATPYPHTLGDDANTRRVYVGNFSSIFPSHRQLYFGTVHAKSSGHISCSLLTHSSRVQSLSVIGFVYRLSSQFSCQLALLVTLLLAFFVILLLCSLTLFSLVLFLLCSPLRFPLSRCPLTLFSHAISLTLFSLRVIQFSSSLCHSQLWAVTKRIPMNQ